jgi:hypothetical protein
VHQTSTKHPSFIDPGRLYTRRGYIAASGISETRIRSAKKLGIEISTLSVGKRVFARGSSVIEFIEKLAALETSEG